jgi:hypothetical protein
MPQTPLEKFQSLMAVLSFSVPPSANGAATSNGSTIVAQAEGGKLRVRLDRDVSGKTGLHSFTVSNDFDSYRYFNVAAALPIPPIAPGALFPNWVSETIPTPMWVPGGLYASVSFMVEVPPLKQMTFTGRFTNPNDLDGDGDVDAADLAILLGNGATAEEIAKLLGAWTV